MTKRPRLVATTTTSLLAILCLFSVNTLLLPQAPWASSSETGVGHYRAGNHIGHSTSGGPGRRVLLSLPEEVEVGDSRESTAARLSVGGEEDTEGDDYTTVDCTKADNQSTFVKGCQTVKDRTISRDKPADNSSVDDPDEVLQNWIKRNRKPVDLPRATRGFRSHRVRRPPKWNAARLPTVDNGERGLQSTHPFYRYQDDRNHDNMLSVEDLLLEAAYMIDKNGLDQEYGSGAGRGARRPRRRNLIVNKNNTVYLLLSGVDFTVIHIPSSPPMNSSNSRDKATRPKMTFILPDNSQSAASFDEGKEVNGDQFPPTGGSPTYQLLQLDFELVNATRIRSPVPDLRHRAPGSV